MILTSNDVRALLHRIRQRGARLRRAGRLVHAMMRERDEAMANLSAAHALLRHIVETNGEQDYGIVAKARDLLGIPESRLNPDPDSEHYHE